MFDFFRKAHKPLKGNKTYPNNFVGTVGITIRYDNEYNLVVRSHFLGFGKKIPRGKESEDIILKIFDMYDFLEKRNETHPKDSFVVKGQKKK